jgi:TPR repeat protein
MENKDPRRAALEFKNAAQATPNDPEAYYQLGLAYWDAMDPRASCAAFRKALSLNAVTAPVLPNTLASAPQSCCHVPGLPDVEQNHRVPASVARNTCPATQLIGRPANTLLP